LYKAGQINASIFKEKMEISQKNLKITQVAMVKGVMNCPKRLNLEKIENSFVTVTGESGKTQMTLKAEYVYQYDEDVYQRLQNAYELNGKGTLEKLWQQAKPITLS
jgi:hypothetical protein